MAGEAPILSNEQDLANMLDESQAKFSLSQGRHDSLDAENDALTWSSQMPVPTASGRPRSSSQE